MRKTPMKIALPIGLLLMSLPRFIEIVGKVDIPDAIQGFLMGAGMAILLCGVKSMRKRLPE